MGQFHFPGVLSHTNTVKFVRTDGVVHLMGAWQVCRRTRAISRSPPCRHCRSGTNAPHEHVEWLVVARLIRGHAHASTHRRTHLSRAHTPHTRRARTCMPSLCCARAKKSAQLLCWTVRCRILAECSQHMPAGVQLKLREVTLKKRGVCSLLNFGCETCFARSTREAGWDAKRIPNQDFWRHLQKEAGCYNLWFMAI